MSMYSNINKSISSYYASLKEQYSARYLREVMIGVVVLVALGGGYFLNKFYVQYREEQAFLALSEAVDSFTQSQRIAQSLDPQKDKEKTIQAWQNTEMLLDALHKEHMNSYLAPYFLVFKSQMVLERDGDLEKAIKLLDDALIGIPKNSELGSLYYIKRIKMGFDSHDAAVKEKSLHDLIKITQDSNDYAFEEALYLLGEYYLSIDDVVKANESFQKLVKSADAQALLKSPWVKLAREKLGVTSQDEAE